ncbi:tetratricopeptide repeat protein [Pseudoxanthomonas daejeonensis]|uniref:tetratricopeptide repeat protein n=1 Tax=Pseudoxanthomonas daejeonensis TaxID=266062 RepID=UPI003CCE3476
MRGGEVVLGDDQVKKLLFPLALGLALFSLSAAAQSLPAPKEFYFDPDPQTTRAIVAVPGEGDAVVDRLASTVARKPADVESRVQLARIAMQTGRLELGDELYRAAQKNAGSNQRLARAVAWNYGWDLYRAGEHPRALEQWQKLIGGWPSTPSWQPPTLALALWKMGHKAEAIAWYAAAVRTEPQQWSVASTYAQMLPDWREEDRGTLAEVQAAWQADPPAWP